MLVFLSSSGIYHFLYTVYCNMMTVVVECFVYIALSQVYHRFCLGFHQNMGHKDQETEQKKAHFESKQIHNCENKEEVGI